MRFGLLYNQFAGIALHAQVDAICSAGARFQCRIRQSVLGRCGRRLMDAVLTLGTLHRASHKHSAPSSGPFSLLHCCQNTLVKFAWFVNSTTIILIKTTRQVLTHR